VNTAFKISNRIKKRYKGDHPKPGTKSSNNPTIILYLFFQSTKIIQKREVKNMVEIYQIKARIRDRYHSFGSGIVVVKVSSK